MIYPQPDMSTLDYEHVPTAIHMLTQVRDQVAKARCTVYSCYALEHMYPNDLVSNGLIDIISKALGGRSYTVSTYLSTREPLWTEMSWEHEKERRLMMLAYMINQLKERSNNEPR